VYNNLKVYFNLITDLGILSILRVSLYRGLSKLGYFKIILPVETINVDTIYLDNDYKANNLQNSIDYFSKYPVKVATCPDWFSNPFDSEKVANSSIHWTQIRDFNSNVGDIKIIWEASRFDWSPKLAFSSREQPDSNGVETIERWTTDWLKKNPINRGSNWKCAQEASLRSLNILLTAKIIGAPYNKPSQGLLIFLQKHVQRILPTTFYALAQRNNHATSEGCALLTIGLFLQKHGSKKQINIGKKAEKKGRYLLEYCSKNLILSDGSFAQHSTNYHRLMLDTISVTELFREDFGAQALSKQFYTQMASATNWLHTVLNDLSGGAPNLGSNDGAYFGNIDSKPYWDFRPSVQRTLNIFCRKKIKFEENAICKLFDRDINSLPIATANRNRILPAGGYATIQPADNIQLFFSSPNYVFRPTHCDANHIDLWANGYNLLFDDGSYSYNHSVKELEGYFGSTGSHNTIMFDDEEQMPRVGRFLRSNWIRYKYFSLDENGNLSSEYKDHRGCIHSRTVNATHESVLITDNISGYKQHADLYWRLRPGKYEIYEDRLIGELFDIEINSENEHEIKLIQGNCSNHYLELTTIPVLSVHTINSKCLTTRITIK